MHVTWLYGGDDGESHFADLEIPTTDADGGRWFTEFIPAYGVSFTGAPTPIASGYHPAPRRQFVLQIAGTAEVELKDGSSRVFGPGDVCSPMTPRDAATSCASQDRPRRSAPG
jgi:hypothetical protein